MATFLLFLADSLFKDSSAGFLEFSLLPPVHENNIRNLSTIATFFYVVPLMCICLFADPTVLVAVQVKTPFVDGSTTMLYLYIKYRVLPENGSLGY